MNELTELSNDINVITAEINSYKQIAGQSIFEIGKRLKYVKETDLSHGEWESWCKNELNLSLTSAKRYMKIFDKFGNRPLVGDLSLKKMDLLSSLDDEQLETPVETSSGETKKPTEMTQREIEEYKKALKQAEEDKKRLGQLLTEERNKPQQVKVVEKVIKDEAEIKHLQIQMKHIQRELEAVENEKTALERKIQLEKNDAEKFRNLQKDLNELKDRRKDMIRQIENAGTIGKFIARVEKSFEEDLAPVKYTRAIEELNDSKAVLEALERIVSRVEGWCKEIRSIMPKENYINVEVIDYE